MISHVKEIFSLIPIVQLEQVEMGKCEWASSYDDCII